ncbi:hypothetical protein B9C88_01730 [Brevibacillus laterosporus]|nr:hypothetical protein B9C88_01730 [Brevibacillus laterosporus]
MKKMFLTLFLCLSIPISGCGSSQPAAKPEGKDAQPVPSATNPTPESKEGFLTKDNVSLVISLLEPYSPPTLDDHVLKTKDDISKWIWFNKLQTWTDDLTRLLSSNTKLDETAKEIIIARLNKYFVPEESEAIFATFFSKESDGTYASIPTERFGSGTSSIDEDLKVILDKKDSKMIVRITGTEYDYLDPKSKQKNKVDVEFSLVEKDNHFLISGIEHH